MSYFSSTPDVGAFYDMHFRWSSYYKFQAHCSSYVLAQGIELKGFIRINDRAEVSFVCLA
jgi:hypothetical protein